MLLIIISFIVIGCSQDRTNNKIYNSSWDEQPIVVKRMNDDIVNEITDRTQVEKLINVLKKANWEENVDVDIRPADYYFTWNSFVHYVWMNEEYKRVELSIEGESNFVTLSTKSSKVVYEILTGKEI